MSIESLRPSTAISKPCLPEGKGTGVAGMGVTKDTELVTFHKGNSRASWMTLCDIQIAVT